MRGFCHASCMFWWLFLPSDQHATYASHTMLRCFHSQELLEHILVRYKFQCQPRHGGCIAGGKISKLPVDLERATSRIWSYALHAERKAVMYNDITARRLGHLVELMEAYEIIRAMLPVAEYSLPRAGVSAGSPCHGCNTSEGRRDSAGAHAHHLKAAWECCRSHG